MTPNFPPSRGLLNYHRFSDTIFDRNAPEDKKGHYPSGDKDNKPGAARQYQIAHADFRGWIPFRPMDSDYHWRYGVCGDKIDSIEHLRGGKYYYAAKIVAQYIQGDTISLKIGVPFNHGGFLLMHVCDVSKCGGEISPHCFKTPGACHLLERAAVPECEDNQSDRCSPIDPAHPGRWYFPCSKKSETGRYDTYGPETMQFKLPSDVYCDHCVLHWHWETANFCTPDGIREYFDGPHGPKAWNGCRLDGGIIEGYNPKRPSCGNLRNNYKMGFSEEYGYCSDIEIMRQQAMDPASPSPLVLPSESVSASASMTGSVSPSASASAPGIGVVEPSPSDTIETPSASVSMPTTAVPSFTPPVLETTAIPSASLSVSPSASTQPSISLSTSPSLSPSASVSAIATSTVSTSSSASPSTGPPLEPIGVSYLSVLYEGEPILNVTKKTTIYMPSSGAMSFEAVTTGAVNEVKFFVNKRLEVIDVRAPFLISGDHGRPNWRRARRFLTRKSVKFRVIARNTETGQKAKFRVRLKLRSGSIKKNFKNRK